MHIDDNSFIYEVGYKRVGEITSSSKVHQAVSLALIEDALNSDLYSERIREDMLDRLNSEEYRSSGLELRLDSGLYKVVLYPIKDPVEYVISRGFKLPFLHIGYKQGPGFNNIQQLDDFGIWGELDSETYIQPSGANTVTLPAGDRFGEVRLVLDIVKLLEYTNGEIFADIEMLTTQDLFGDRPGASLVVYGGINRTSIVAIESLD